MQAVGSILFFIQLTYNHLHIDTLTAESTTQGGSQLVRVRRLVQGHLALTHGGLDPTLPT